MAKYTVTHPVKNFTGNFAGLGFDKGTVSFDSENTFFERSMGENFDEAIANLQSKYGCTVTVKGTEYEAAVVDEGNKRALAAQAAKEDQIAGAALTDDPGNSAKVDAAKKASGKVAQANADVLEAVAATRTAKVADEADRAKAIADANAPQTPKPTKVSKPTKGSEPTKVSEPAKDENSQG